MRYCSLISLLLILGACGKSADEAAQSKNIESTVDPIAEYEAPAPSSSYDEALAAATTAIDHAAERGHAWTTADTLLEQAVAAAAEGDRKSATVLADRARIQAELAVRQADVEESTWQGRVLPD